MHSFWHTKQRPLSYFPMLIEESEVAPYLDRSAPPETCTIACAERSLLYHYMVQEWVERSRGCCSTLPALIILRWSRGCIENVLLESTGLSATAFSIPKGISSLPNGVLLPPLFITHGSKDDKVPIEQSIAVVEAMKAGGHSVGGSALPPFGLRKDLKFSVCRLASYSSCRLSL